RLSNKVLIEAPRSEYVYVALLQRKGLDRKYRLEALEGLSKARHTDVVTETIGGITQLDKKGAEFEDVLRELAGLLLQAKPAELASKRAELALLANSGELPLTRQIGYAALMTAHGSVKQVWTEAEAAKKLSDLLLAIPLLRDPSLRSSLYPNVQAVLLKSDIGEARRAAIVAAVALPGHDAETFNILGAFVKAGTERPTAISALQRIPRKGWAKDKAEPLIESLLSYLQSVPVNKRTEPDVISAFQFASDLTSL